MRQKNCEVTKENKQVPLYERYQEGYNMTSDPTIEAFGESLQYRERYQEGYN